jgi:hypothetical protein
MKRDLLSNAASRPTIDWRGADWYATSRATNEEERASHEAAVGILQEYEATGRPFALFLRLFKLNLLYESHDGSPVKALVVDLRDELQTRGASFIQVQNTDDVGRIVDKVSHDLPSLFLEDARWLDVVKALIGRAEMIVCECPSLAAGLSAELQACVELARVDRTVVVVASSAELEYVGNKTWCNRFTE